MSKSWEQILGGYATDTLTEEEKRQLFEAALHDQTLFDALADEEALKALLADPEVRQRILVSLETSGELQGGASSSRSGWFWFRQPSSLAWAGGIAAMGLALIFGWQMEKDWGPMVQQEQHVEYSVSENKDEAAFRSQPSGPVEIKEQPHDTQKNDQRKPERVGSQHTPVLAPKSSTITQASKEKARMRQSPSQDRSEGISRKGVKKERRLKAKQPVVSAPQSDMVQSLPEEDQFVAPPVGSTEKVEEGFQQRPQTLTFADQVRKGDTLISPDAKELFYANEGRQADGADEEINGMRAQQLLGGMSSEKEQDEASDLNETPKAVLEAFSPQTRGIRYRFVREISDGRTEAVDIKQYSGKWSELRLTIESNVSGHLYVLTSFGKGKWQFMKPKTLIRAKSFDRAIKVMAYQSVDFGFNQIANRLGKPIVSSIVVLLSSERLTDVGEWVGTMKQSEIQLSASGDQGVFVVDQRPKSEKPLWIKIPLVH